ncbi:hypothetical protein [uncultured Jatrophihabitans sp.]|uniref:hypothetical protein n=1 Tax=uncultured Jatrophihabitans sp. TaxID=1610747 RepID=UPI0035C990D6
MKPDVAEAPTQPAAGDTSTAPDAAPSTRRLRPGLALVLVAQAAWVAVLCARGWFYQDDLSSMDAAAGRPLGWRYLTDPVNDHLVPGLRLVFWLQERAGALDWAPTVVARVALQTLAVYLLHRLLTMLCGDRPGVLVLTALYALNPLIVCNLTWLTTAAGLVPAQLTAILAVHHHVRYTITGRLHDAGYAGLALLVGMCFWEKTAIIAVLLPVISAGYLTSGSARSRVSMLLRRWPGWLCTLAPPLVFVGYFVIGGYGGHARGVSATNLLAVLRTTWWRTIAPSMLDGPWSWTSTPELAVSFTASPIWLCVVAQVLTVVLLVAGWRRNGVRSLWGWSLPLISLVIGTALVAVGRYQFYGELLATTIRYSFDVTLVLVLGIALALLPSTPTAIAARVAGKLPPAAAVATPRVRSRRAALLRTGIAVLTVFAIVDAGLSALRFERRWVEDPTHAYADTLSRSVRTAGPTANLYDTSVTTRVLPSFGGPTVHVSRLIGWLGLPARFDRTDTDATIVDAHGRLRPAGLFGVAYARTAGPNSLCNDLVRGVGTRTQPLIGTPSKNEYFLHIEYFQRRPTTVYIRLLDAQGKAVEPVRGTRVSLTRTLGALTLRLPYATPRVLQIRSENASTNVCVANAMIGFPVARGTR